MKRLFVLTCTALVLTSLHGEDLVIEENVPVEELTSLSTTNQEQLILDEEITLLEKEIQRDLEETQAVPDLLPNLLLLEEDQIAESDLSILTEENPDFEVAITEQVEPDMKSDASLEEPYSLVSYLETPQEALATLDVEEAEKEKPAPVFAVNLAQAFAGSPVIYMILLVLSVGAVSIWLYSVVSLQQATKTSEAFLKDLQAKLLSNQFDEALFLCDQNQDIFSKMIACGIHCRGGSVVSLVEAMRAEGKRASIHYWQKIGLLNDIAIVAPMVGLMGTVLGMFYAFYDINRSIESITTLFDGLGISVGTTVAGLAVAILALVLHSTAKYRLVRVLARVENEAHAFANLLNDQP